MSTYYKQRTILDAGLGSQRIIRYDQYPQETLLSGEGGEHGGHTEVKGCIKSRLYCIVILHIYIYIARFSHIYEEMSLPPFVFLVPLS